MPERRPPGPGDVSGGTLRAPVTVEMRRRPADLAPATEAADTRTPMAMVFDAFRRTRTAGNPYQPEHQDSRAFRTALIGKLGLDGPVRDKRGLTERFIDTDPRDDVLAVMDDSDTLLRTVTRVISMAHSEIDQRAADPEAPQEVPSEAQLLQRQVVRDLVAVAARQYRREMPEVRQRTRPATSAELQPEIAESNAHVDELTSELLMMAPDSIHGDEFRGLRQIVFEHEFTSSVMRHEGAAQDALIVARTIQRELGFTVDEGDADAEQLPRAQVFIQRERGAALESYAIEGLDTLTSEQRHLALATAMGAETGSSFEDYWVQYDGEKQPHRLAPAAA